MKNQIISSPERHRYFVAFENIFQIGKLLRGKAIIAINIYAPRKCQFAGIRIGRLSNPLYINISHGEADIQTVLADGLALTKLNYNACIYADGLPVTRKFANAVGEILTAGPMKGTPPLPFKHYI